MCFSHAELHTIPNVIPRPGQAPAHAYPTRFLPTMDMDISQVRSRQPATSCGLGAHFTSPAKKRPGKRKTQVLTSIAFDATRKKQRLQEDLAAMLATELPVIPEEEFGLTDSGGQIRVEDERQAIEELPEGLSGQEPFDLTDNLEEAEFGFYQTHPESTCSDDNISGSHSSMPMKDTRKRITPDQATTILYEKWKVALPLLVDDILAYTTTSVGAASKPVGSELRSICCSSDVKTTKVTCLYFDRTSGQFL